MNNSKLPEIGGTEPVKVSVEQGKSYWWCSCGKSLNQPFCDGSHKGTEFRPLNWVAPESRTVYFCTCKRTANNPLCDGAHKNLES